MGSMSYCLFENTANELSRCVTRMEDAATLRDLKLADEYERRAFMEMFRTCRAFLAEHERLLNAQAEVDLSDKCYG